MALEPVIVRCPNLPKEYGVPVPTGIKKLILSVLDLPKTTSGASYNYLSDIEIVDGLMYYVMPMNVVDNDIYTATLGVSDSNYNDSKYVKVIDPNSVFIHHSERQSVYSSVAYLEPKNGYPRNKIDSIEQFDIKLPCPYVFGSDYNSGGSIAVNEDNVSVEGYAIDVVCKIKFSIVDKSGKYDDEKTYSNRISISSIISSLGMRLPYREITGSGANLYSLGNSSELNINMYRPNVVYGSTFSYGFWVNVSNYTKISSTLSKIYTNNSGTISSLKPSDLFAEIPTSLYYLLFPKIIFADTVERIDTLLRMSPEDFKNEIKYNIGTDPYAPVNPSAPSGGNGSYGNGENYFDTVGRIPNGSAEANDSRSTLYTRYLVSLTEFSVLGEWLWADDLGLQIAKTAISFLYGDPVQTVISCVSYPFNLSSLASSSSVPFHWGGHDAGFSLNALNTNAFSIDWGTIFLSEYWGNFLDYSPHTQMQLYLPWGTGFVHIDPNDIINANSNSSWTGTGILGVKTNVDLSRGICVHNVIANNTVIGSYSGSCGRQIPITGSDYASKQVSMAGAAIGAMVAGGISAGMGAQAASTGQNIFGEPPSDINRRYMTNSSIRADMFGSEVSAVGRMAIRPAIASAAALAVSPPSVSRSGSFQEGAGSLSIQQPYLIISRPKMSMPQNYGHMYGYPSNISATLSSLSGYTEVGNIHLEGIYATSEELNEIESLLKSGVLL